MIFNSQEGVMTDRYKRKAILLHFILVLLFLFLPLKIETVYAHGGKEHGSGAFTPLMAVQKATDLFDQLISLSKLDDTWETQLIRIEVLSPQTGKKQEFVVSFKRDSGNPDVVYFFFDITGKYTGSNFKSQ